jgi:hypothetical protein
MRYTQEQIERANQTDLVRYLETKGERFSRCGSEYRWKLHDSVTIRGNQWFWHSRNHGGFPIDFLLEFYGMSFTEAVKELTGEDGAGSSMENRKEKRLMNDLEENKKPGTEENALDEGRQATCPIPALELPPKNKDNEKVLDYLVHVRGLDKGIVEVFVQSGAIYEDSRHHNVIFVGSNPEGSPRYAHCRGITEKFRQDVTGSDKGYGFSYRGTSSVLMVFEAAIDLLSFLTLYPRDWQKNSYLALGGVGEKALMQFLSDRPDIEKVYLCLDHDTAGDDGCRRLFEKLPERISVERLVPAAKDWNEVLTGNNAVKDGKYMEERVLLRDSRKPLIPVMKMEDVVTKTVEWLWYPFIPFGKVTLIHGDPGQGKTWLAMQLAAACTNRKELPNMLALEPFNVFYQTAEDGFGDTIKPRLISAGADLNRVRFIIEDEKQLTMTDERIEQGIRENNVRLMIMDPIQAYLGADVDMNRANEIRPIFRRLSEIAERTGCAIVLIGHLNKSAGTQSNYRGLGSIDIAAAVRSILFVGSVEKDDNIRVVIQQKDSLAPKDNPVAFKLSGDRFEWIGEYEITINELMAGNTGKKKETKLETAVKMIRGKLAQRKIMYVTDLEDEGKKLGIGARTVRDARTSIDPELEYGWDGKKRTVKLAEVTLAES